MLQDLSGSSSHSPPWIALHGVEDSVALIVPWMSLLYAIFHDYMKSYVIMISSERLNVCEYTRV